MKWIDIIIKSEKTERHNVQYKNLIFQVNCYNCKPFLFYWFNMFSSWKGLLGDISPLPKLLIQEIKNSITQNEEKYFKAFFGTNISH